MRFEELIILVRGVDTLKSLPEAEQSQAVALVVRAVESARP